MKKILVSLVFMFSLVLSSCVTTGEAVVGDTYFEYSFYDHITGTPIVYISNIPYYRVWRNDAWRTIMVPYDRRIYIRHHQTPHIYTRPTPPPRTRHFYDRNYHQPRYNNPRPIPHRDHMPNMNKHNNRGGRR